MARGDEPAGWLDKTRTMTVDWYVPPYGAWGDPRTGLLVKSEQKQRRGTYGGRWLDQTAQTFTRQWPPLTKPPICPMSTDGAPLYGA